MSRSLADSDEATKAEAVKHVASLLVDSETAVDDFVDSGHLRHEVKALLALLFLQLEGDTADWAALDALHQVGDVTSNLVAELLRGHISDLLADALVGLEVNGQLGVELLDDGASSALHGLGADAALEFLQEKSNLADS